MKTTLLIFIFSVLTLSNVMAQTTIEAEDGVLTGVTVDNTVAGFSGTGYVVYEDTGSVLIEVERANTGEYSLKFGFRSQFDFKIQDLYVNGSKVGSVNFPQSIVFTSLDYGNIELNAGTNTIELRKVYGYMDLDYFLIGDDVNPAPSANAGLQQVIMDVDGNGTETVILDASASTDPNNDIVSYTWFYENGDVAITGQNPVLTFEAAIGGYELTLEVEDAAGNIDTDSVKVFVGDPTNGGNDRIGIVDNSQYIFSSGINLAWDQFASDIVSLNQNYFEGVLDPIQTAGGNSMRWWLHTNGSQSPIFDASGNVTGLNPNTIANMRTVLDMAYERGITLSMCLWSFDMLRSQGQDVNIMKALLSDPVKTQTYIDNALIPILEELGDHPGVLTWEIFNEPENMTFEFGFTAQRTSMANVQQFINLTAGAIHRTVPGALVSNGAGSFKTSTDVDGFTNYYRDDRLIAAGGDPLGTLDFYQVHYYPQNFPLSESPFHRPADWWGLDKPILIGEFPSSSIEEDEAQSYTTTEAYQVAYEYGYAGAMSWDFRGFDGGSFETTKAGLTYLAETYPDDIDINVDLSQINTPPEVIASVPDLNIILENAENVADYVDLNTIFYDVEDMNNLVYTIVGNTNEGLVTAEISADFKLNLDFTPATVGKSTITLRARDTEGASASTSFLVNIREANGNLALFQPIVASTIETDGLNETKANDGDIESRWSSSYQDDQWIYVDLEEPTVISNVKLFWEDAYAKGYEIQISDDGVSWETVFVETVSDGGEDDIQLEDVETQYVRMLGTERNTNFGLSLFEFEIYAGTLSVSNAIVNQDVLIYPNPITNNKLNIQVANGSPISVTLIDVFGRTIEHFDFQGNTKYSIRTTNLGSGLALVRITGLDWTTTKKVIKQ